MITRDSLRLLLGRPIEDLLEYVWRRISYEYEQSSRLGKGQTSHAPEHLLSAAAYVGDVAVVEGLLAQGVVYVNAGSNVFGKPLFAAASAGHLDIVRLLLARGADADDGAYPGTEDDERLLLESGYDKESIERSIARRDMSVYTTLDAAAIGGHEEMVRLLLQPEFGVSRSTYSYRAAIVNAARGGNANVMRLLIEAGEFGAIPEQWLRQLWECALLHAADQGRPDTVRLMLDKGVPVDVESVFVNSLVTPLVLAAAKGHYEVVQLVLQRDAAVDGTPPCIYNPIMKAAAGGYLRTVELLLDHGAVVHQDWAPHPLERAANHSQVHVVRHLLERGAHSKMRYGGALALELALDNGYGSVAAMLMEYGIKLDQLPS